MFKLVRFEDGAYFVCNIARITSVKKTTCTVKYTNGIRYKAVILDSSDDSKHLHMLKKQREMSENLKKVNDDKQEGPKKVEVSVEDRVHCSASSAGKVRKRLCRRVDTKVEEPSTFELQSSHLKLNEPSDNVILNETIPISKITPVSSTPNSDGPTLLRIPKKPVIISDILISQPTQKAWTTQSEANEQTYDATETSYISGTDISAASNNTFSIIKNDILNNVDARLTTSLTSTGSISPSYIDISDNLIISDISLGTIDALMSDTTFDDKIHLNETTNTDIRSNIDNCRSPSNVKNEKPFTTLSLTTNKQHEETSTTAEIVESEAANQSDSASEYIPSDYSMSSDEHSEEEGDENNGDVNVFNNSGHMSTKRRGSRQSLSLNTSTEMNSSKVPVRDDADMYVDTSDGKRGQGKKLFCRFCHTMQAKFARHLETVHKDLPEVKAFAVLPKGNPERKRQIDSVRKKSQFYFNTRSDVNTGELIVTRRPQSKFARSAGHFKVCPGCKGFFSQGNYRHHAKQCFGFDGKRTRTLSVMGRRLVARIRSDASPALEKVFAVLREDNVTRLIRYDRILILYGNKMCRKYRYQHQHDMIRAHLRLLGRFLIELKQINTDIIDFTTIYDPKFYDDVIKAINVVGKFSERTNTYEAPSSAYSLGSSIKKIGNFLITDCIKRHDATQKSNTEDFLKLLIEDIGVTVNKTVVETQSQVKRRKKVELPSLHDIQKLHTHLKERRALALQSLKKEFTFDAWILLAQVTLTSVQAFNRRRAGEIERMYIDDFKSYERINSDHYKSLEPAAQSIARKYVRFVIRGKLNRTVAVLLSAELLECVEAILRYRNEAQVPAENPYVFGIPGREESRFKYLRSCVLMRKFANDCGAQFPEKLTGTKLRKHIATNCINLNLSENEIADVANFMGHAEKIHKEHYRQPIVSREILRMSRVLELAQGDEEIDQEDSDESDDNENNDAASTPQNYSNRSKVTSASSRPQTSVQTSRHSFPNGGENVLKRSQKYLKSNGKPKKEVRKRSTSPYGNVKRKKRWTPEETEIAWRLFDANVKSRIYPSLKDIQQVTRNYPCLASRSPSVVKVWISNQIKKKNNPS